MNKPVFETTIFDLISVNGRISKKLFEKIVTPRLKEIESLKEANKVLRNAVYNATPHDSSCSIELYGFCSCDSLGARLALAKADEIMGVK